MKYKCLTFIVMLYALVGFLTPAFFHKYVVFFDGYIPAGILFGALAVCIGDMIAEIYGMKVYIRMFLEVSIVQFILALICVWVSHLPSPSTWHDQYSFDLIFSSIPAFSFIELICVIISNYGNGYYLTKWKFLVQGRYYWMRSMGASLIGEIIFRVGLYIMAFSFGLFNHLTPKEIAMRALLTFITKMALIGFLATPISFVIKIIKAIENNEDDLSYKIDDNFKKKYLKIS